MFFYQFSFITMQAQVPYYPQNILPLSLNNKIFTKIFCHKTPFKNEILLKNLIKAKWWQNTLYDHVFLKKNTPLTPDFSQKVNRKWFDHALLRCFSQKFNYKRCFLWQKTLDLFAGNRHQGFFKNKLSQKVFSHNFSFIRRSFTKFQL